MCVGVGCVSVLHWSFPTDSLRSILDKIFPKVSDPDELKDIVSRTSSADPAADHAVRFCPEVLLKKRILRKKSEENKIIRVDTGGMEYLAIKLFYSARNVHAQHRCRFQKVLSLLPISPDETIGVYRVGDRRAENLDMARFIDKFL